VSKSFELLQQLQLSDQANDFPMFISDNVASTGYAKESDQPGFTQQNRQRAEKASLHLSDSHLAREEALKLAHAVFLSQSAARRSVIVFAAIDSGNGCSQICGLTARALASSVRSSVCLVDANFRNVNRASLYSTSSLIGLAEALRQPGPIREFTIPVGPGNLSLLPRGGTALESAGFLSSRSMKTRIEDLRNEFAHVIIDAPPLNSYADAVGLGQQTDGIVLILEANSTRRESALRISEHLRGAAVTVLGAVLNKRTFPIPEPIYQLL